MFPSKFTPKVEASWHKFVMILIRKLAVGMKKDFEEDDTFINANSKRGHQLNRDTKDEKDIEEEDDKKDYLPLLIITFLYYFGKCFVSFIEIAFFRVKSIMKNSKKRV